jgi:hypothetical protein
VSQGCAKIKRHCRSSGAVVKDVLLVGALQLRAHQPQMVHVLPAVGTKSGNDEARRTFCTRGTAASAGPGDWLGKFTSGIVEALSDVANRAALTRSFVDGSANASTQAAQREPFGAERIGDGASTWAAGSCSGATLLPQ